MRVDEDPVEPADAKDGKKVFTSFHATSQSLESKQRFKRMMKNSL